MNINLVKLLTNAGLSDIGESIYNHCDESARMILPITCRSLRASLPALQTKMGLCDTAAKCGHPELLKWAIQNKYKYTNLYAIATTNGHLNVIQWMYENNIPCNNRTRYHAAVNGHMHIIKWIYQYKFPKEKWICVCTADEDECCAFFYAVGDICTMDKMIYEHAVFYDQKDIAKFIKEQHNANRMQ